jgi:hypothetical protein
MRALALVLTMLCATAAHSDTFIIKAEGAPQQAGERVLWQMNAGTSTALVPGYFWTDEKVVRISTRLDYLENKAAKDCMNGSILADKEMFSGASGLLWGLGVGLLVGGFASYLAVKKL